jgi:hypothetical protein
MRTSGAILGARRGPSRFRRMLRVGPAGAKSLSLLFVCLSLSLSLSQEGTEESMETLTTSTSILEGEVPDLANSFATLSSLSTTM